MINKPVWLDDANEIAALCSQFLDRLDKQPATDRRQPVKILLNEKTMPTLFRQGESADRLWDLIKSLDEDHHVFHIRQQKHKDPFVPVYRQARLTLQVDGEEVLRRWLQRAKGQSSLQVWRAIVAARRHCFPGITEKLSARRIVVSGIGDENIVDSFASLSVFQYTKLSLRQLSSRCFWGNSKFLDNREELVRELYPEMCIVPRPVMVNIFIPVHFDGILFIENQDCYTQAIARNPAICKKLVLVYMAGFKASAARVREEAGVSLHFHGDGCRESQKKLEAWWFGHESGNLPVYFWGDLDFSGMGILKALKERFSEVSAWQPGYQPMLDVLWLGKGHQPEMADKQSQLNPGMTGCDFADTVLLSAIVQVNNFVDQEVVFDTITAAGP